MSDALLQLDFLLGLFKPLLRLEEASFLLDGASDDHLVRLIDEGQLRAVNIALSLSTRRELRIYRASVERMIFCRAYERVPARHALEVEQLIGVTRPILLKGEVARVLSCSEQHVANLSFSGPNLARLEGKTMPRYYRASLIQFLTEREIRP